MEFRDYYEVMGIARDATQDEVKRAYRKLARKYHPDVSEDESAEEKFKEVGEAYEVLKDPEKRAAYDQLGKNWKAGEDFRPPPDWDEGFEFSGPSGGAGDGYSGYGGMAASSSATFSKTYFDKASLRVVAQAVAKRSTCVAKTGMPASQLICATATPVQPAVLRCMRRR